MFAAKLPFKSFDDLRRIYFSTEIYMTNAFEIS